jgi:hypothetical protein
VRVENSWEEGLTNAYVLEVLEGDYLLARRRLFDVVNVWLEVEKVAARLYGARKAYIRVRDAGGGVVVQTSVRAALLAKATRA